MWWDNWDYCLKEQTKIGEWQDIKNVTIENLEEFLNNDTKSPE